MAALCQIMDLLPASFPEGTRYVIEGEPDLQGGLRIVSRRIIFPDGLEVHLSAAATQDERLWHEPLKRQG